MEEIFKVVIQIWLDPELSSEKSQHLKGTCFAFSDPRAERHKCSQHLSNHVEMRQPFVKMGQTVTLLLSNFCVKEASESRASEKQMGARPSLA